MPRMPSLKEILDSNPDVNPEQLKQQQEMLIKLREIRGQRRGYRLASPITRRRIVVGDAERRDSRTVHLGIRK